MKFYVPIKSKWHFNNTYKKRTKAFKYVLNKIQNMISSIIKYNTKEKVKFNIKGRVKNSSSLYQKLLKKSKNLKDGDYIDITDIVALRITCPFIEDITKVRDILDKNFKIKEEFEKGNEKFKEFGYSSVHYLIDIPHFIANNMKKEILNGKEIHDVISFLNNSNDKEKIFLIEIQIRTILQDAWAEVEHEVIYKSQFAPIDEPLRRKLAALNANLVLADTIFQEIRFYQNALLSRIEDEKINFINYIENFNDLDYAYHSSEDYIDLALNLRMDKKDILILEAIESQKNKDYNHAIEKYSDLLNSKSKKSLMNIAYIQRSLCYFFNKDYTNAINDLNSALEYEGNDHRKYFYRGVCHIYTDELHKALDDFDNSINIKPTSECYYNRSKCQYKLKNFISALEDCIKAMSMDKDNKKIAYFLNHILYKEIEFN